MGLLDKAKSSYHPRGRKSRHADEDLQELCLAWLRGEITSLQAADALGVRTALAARSTMQSWVATSIRRGKLKVEVVK